MHLILLLLFAFAAAASHVELFRDDFAKFPPGWLSKPVGLLNGAIQEYHYLPHRGVPTYPWYNPITHNDSWVAGDEDGKTYLEQHLLHDQPERWQPLFVTGDPFGPATPCRRRSGRCRWPNRRASSSDITPTIITTSSQSPAARRRGWR